MNTKTDKFDELLTEINNLLQKKIDNMNNENLEIVGLPKPTQSEQVKIANKLVAVYGSLRQGLNNHRLLNKAPLRTEVVSIPYQMISLGAYPALIKSEENHNITIEVYSVDDDTLKRLNRLEGFYEEDSDENFYNRKTIQTHLGDAYVYVIDRGYSSFRQTNVVENGDWFEYLTNK